MLEAQTRCSRTPVSSPWWLKPALSRHNLRCIQCRTIGVDRCCHLGKYLSPSPNNSSIPPALFANHVAKAWLLYFFFLKEEKKVDDSLRLKSCAIQQMNFLFCFLSLLIYGIQLNIIEAGSWFAVWAI